LFVGNRYPQHSPSMETVKTFGRRLRSIRRERGFTQEELADRCERSVEAISNLERGVSVPSLETVERLAQALDVPVASFFSGGEEGRRADMLARVVAAAQALDDTDLYVALLQIRALRDRPRADAIPAIVD
jgi:transcriptional regulator with XRE-family HTH domain